MRPLLFLVCLTALLNAQNAAPRIPKETLPPILLPWESEVHTKEVDNQPYPAHKIAGNLYYVGTAGYASFLITSPQGHILINPNFEDSVPIVQKNVEKLGFKFQKRKF